MDTDEGRMPTRRTLRPSVLDATMHPAGAAAPAISWVSWKRHEMNSRPPRGSAAGFSIQPFNHALIDALAGDDRVPWGHLGVLTAWRVLGALVAVRRFRWEAR
ncbi:hypothetical protein [Jiangella mangrovi]|uniref:Uncharacterized protein n=1 Tax=Jiangella mangrovi TaxID=1524084 RepID=A0A7W9GV70_9ACTN|nr:hypothetical protein [Jiangella mangrovi]MBB5790389.1 hypothetical protein [Jiangella mangrovi]